MTRFRDITTLQKLAAAHASIHNLFNLKPLSIGVKSSSRAVRLRCLSDTTCRVAY